MGYPDNLSLAALDHETSDRPAPVRVRKLNLIETELVAHISEISGAICDLADFADENSTYFPEGSDAKSYLTSIIADGLTYIQALRTEIQAIPRREAEAEERRREDDQNEAGRECER